MISRVYPSHCQGPLVHTSSPPPFMSPMHNMTPWSPPLPPLCIAQAVAQGVDDLHCHITQISGNRRWDGEPLARPWRVPPRRHHTTTALSYTIHLFTTTYPRDPSHRIHLYHRHLSPCNVYTSRRDCQLEEQGRPPRFQQLLSALLGQLNRRREAPWEINPLS